VFLFVYLSVKSLIHLPVIDNHSDQSILWLVLVLNEFLMYIRIIHLRNLLAGSAFTHYNKTCFALS